MNVKLQQQSRLPVRRQIDGVANWVVLLPHPLRPAEVRKIPYGAAMEIGRAHV